jgi:cysteine desulfurase
MTRIYLDHAATTPLSAAVRDAMMPWLEHEFGNPSSLHREGRRAKDALDQARETVSRSLGALFAEIVFTGSGTEAANLAVAGVALANRDARRSRILISAVEHHCVLNTRPFLERLGYRVEFVPVDRIARVRLDQLERQLGDDVLLVSVMQANNEFGVLQPVGVVAELAHRHGSLFHSDAVQCLPLLVAAGHLPDADLVTLSAHKIGGPKGVGAIYTRAGVKPTPILVGGGQEREMRAGTENVAGIVGFAAAVAQLPGKPDPRPVRDAFLNRLAQVSGWTPSVPDIDDVLPGHVHGRFPGMQAEPMLIRLDRMGLAAGSGAACSSGSLDPSHVMLAAGYSMDESREGLRFTFGPDTTMDEAEAAAAIVEEAALAIRTSLNAR